MSDDFKRLDGQEATRLKNQKENLAKIFGNVDDTHQLIVICTDLTGKSPTHIHIQGPSTDKVLLYGMLEVAKDVVQLNGTKKNN